MHNAAGAVAALPGEVQGAIAAAREFGTHLSQLQHLRWPLAANRLHCPERVPQLVSQPQSHRHISQHIQSIPKIMSSLLCYNSISCMIWLNVASTGVKASPEYWLY